MRIAYSASDVIERLIQITHASSRRELARIMGWNEGTVGSWATRGSVPEAKVSEVAKRFDVDVQWIWFGDDDGDSFKSEIDSTKDIIRNMLIAYRIKTRTQLSRCLGLANPSVINGWIARDTIPRRWLDKTYRDTGVRAQYQDEVDAAQLTEIRTPKLDEQQELYTSDLVAHLSENRQRMLQTLLEEFNVEQIWNRMKGIDQS